MKQNIILIVILIGLFVFGLLIYDFSDALDDVLYDSSWYIYEDGKLNKIGSLWPTIIIRSLFWGRPKSSAFKTANLTL